MIYVLALNHIRDVKVEMLQPVAWSDTAEALRAWMDRERVLPYQSDYDPSYQRVWHHTFRKGGPLEWYNPPEYAPGSGVRGLPISLIEGKPVWDARPATELVGVLRVD